MRQWPVPHCLEVRLGEGRGEEGGGNSDREKFKGIVAKGGSCSSNVKFNERQCVFIMLWKYNAIFP